MDAIKKDQLEGKLRSFLAEGGLHKIFTPNAEIILAAQRDEAFKEVLNKGDLNIADGFGVVLVDRFLTRLDTNCVHQTVDRITGVDTLELLCQIASDEGKSVLFYGAGPGVAEKAAEVMRKRHIGLKIEGIDPGQIADTIVPHSFLEQVSNIDILAVALGHGKQEHFICSALNNAPGLKIAIGVGGALDYISGNVQRAPVWMRNIGFEWLYRLIQQPERIGRIANAVIVFPLVVIWDRINRIKGEK